VRAGGRAMKGEVVEVIPFCYVSAVRGWGSF